MKAIPFGCEVKVERDEHETAISQQFPATDAGNGELIAALYGDRLRYDHRRGRWLLWSDHHWAPDCEAAIRGLAVQAARFRYHKADTIADKKAREEEARHAIRSESRDKVLSALFFAAGLEPIRDRGDRWDRDPHVLGCLDGVVELKTGRLRHGHPNDRITMNTGFHFDQAATCPRWLQFLAEVFENNTELIDWVHRALGHSITGDTSEQIVCVLHGDGCNGKSVFCTIVRHVLGDYAHVTPFATFEQSARRGIPNDVAALDGRRLIVAAEANENTRLNEARIKALTGGDTVSARFLNNEFFEFRPVLKPWLAVNHLPRVGDLSYGFWRRVRLIPFNRQFKGETADKHLVETLRCEAWGILAWMVRGAVEWYSRGLDPAPEAVLAATAAYQHESDELGEFIAERLFINEACTAKAGQLFKAYSAWTDDRGMKRDDRLSATAFGRRMGQRFRKATDRSGTTYHGVGLRLEEQSDHE